MLNLRRLSNNDPAIAQFGRLQESTYFDPEMLIPAAIIGQMLESNNAQRQNFLLVLEEADEVVAGTLFHYLATDVGFSSYMAVAKTHRRQGLARQLHQARLALLLETSRTLHGLFIDVVNPARLTPAELELEQRLGSDPWTRLQAFARLGFRRVDVAYVQPVGGADGGAVTNMDLLFCPLELKDLIATKLVADTMQAYWKPWLGAAVAKKEAQALAARASSEQIRLLPPND